MEKTNQSVVIVGAGQAGAVAAQSLREAGHTGTITMIGAEPETPYERPELSKGYLSGKAPFETLQILPADKLKALDISFSPSTEVVEIDTKGQNLHTSTGETIPFDALILATGGSPRALEGTLCLRTREDADALRENLSWATSVGIIGAGWLGLEVAAHARDIGLETCVYEMENSLCARVLPQNVSDHLQEAHVADGVAFSLGSVPDISNLSARHDLLIACIGMIANDSLAQGAGLEADGGFLVNENQMTSGQNIYAIGDCARPRDTHRVESWAYANISARRAAAAICGVENGKEEPLWFWSKQGSISLQMIGNWNTDLHVEKTETKSGGVVWTYRDGGEMAGIIACNSPRDFAKARRLF